MYNKDNQFPVDTWFECPKHMKRHSVTTYHTLPHHDLNNQEMDDIRKELSKQCDEVKSGKD